MNSGFSFKHSICFVLSETLKLFTRLYGTGSAMLVHSDQSSHFLVAAKWLIIVSHAVSVMIYFTQTVPRNLLFVRTRGLTSTVGHVCFVGQMYVASRAPLIRRPNIRYFPEEAIERSANGNKWTVAHWRLSKANLWEGILNTVLQELRISFAIKF